mmetsp:Transcript_4894/g.12284  ORF Transcript_4894/g.12284 Transcript_4894/m.12284 type:complete len:111 (-) Transcript_4894:58-390(-)
MCSVLMLTVGNDQGLGDDKLGDFAAFLDCGAILDGDVSVKIATLDMLFDRDITDERALECSVLALTIGNNQGLGVDVEFGKIYYEIETLAPTFADALAAVRTAVEKALTL